MPWLDCFKRARCAQGDGVCIKILKSPLHPVPFMMPNRLSSDAAAAALCLFNVFFCCNFAAADLSARIVSCYCCYSPLPMPIFVCLAVFRARCSSCHTTCCLNSSCCRPIHCFNFCTSASAEACHAASGLIALASVVSQDKRVSYEPPIRSFSKNLLALSWQI